jgi:hypothetical protein
MPIAALTWAFAFRLECRQVDHVGVWQQMASAIGFGNRSSRYFGRLDSFGSRPAQVLGPGGDGTVTDRRLSALIDALAAGRSMAAAELSPGYQERRRRNSSTYQPMTETIVLPVSLACRRTYGHGEHKCRSKPR